MIRNTFSLLDGVGAKMEKRLWREGILTWDDFLGSASIPFISGGRKSMYDSALRPALCELEAGNAGYFGSALKRNEHWRLFEVFGDNAVCLDIETNGLMPEAGGYPTVVGFYDGVGYKKFVRGEGLSAESLSEELSRHKLLITFYGSVFDIPFLRRAFPSLDLDMPHYDLCFAARRLGMRGGLKSIEPQFGIKRREEVDGMDGYAAVLLWQRARRGDGEALRLLIAYNMEDTVNLHSMASEIYHRLRESTGIGEFLQTS